MGFPLDLYGELCEKSGGLKAGDGRLHVVVANAGDDRLIGGRISLCCFRGSFE